MLVVCCFKSVKWEWTVKLNFVFRYMIIVLSDIVLEELIEYILVVENTFSEI